MSATEPPEWFEIHGGRAGRAIRRGRLPKGQIDSDHFIGGFLGYLRGYEVNFANPRPQGSRYQFYSVLGPAPLIPSLASFALGGIASAFVNMTLPLPSIGGEVAVFFALAILAVLIYNLVHYTYDRWLVQWDGSGVPTIFSEFLVYFGPIIGMAAALYFYDTHAIELTTDLRLRIIALVIALAAMLVNSVINAEFFRRYYLWLDTLHGKPYRIEEDEDLEEVDKSALKPGEPYTVAHSGTQTRYYRYKPSPNDAARSREAEEWGRTRLVITALTSILTYLALAAATASLLVGKPLQAFEFSLAALFTLFITKGVPLLGALVWEFVKSFVRRLGSIVADKLFNRKKSKPSQ